MKYSLLIILTLLSGCGSVADDLDPLSKINLGIAAWLLWGQDDSLKTENLQCCPKGLLLEDYGPKMARHSFDSKELEQRDYN